MPEAGQGETPLDADLEAAERAAPWLAEARLLLDRDLREVESGGRKLVKTVGWFDRHNPLPTPWCGLFVAHCLKKTLGEIETPRRQLQARPWLDFGRAVEPQLGAIVVLWKVARRAPFGHVGFYWGEDDDAFHLIGGNQEDRIAIERYPKARLLGARWPEGVAETGVRRRRRSDAAASGEYQRMVTPLSP